MTIQEFQERDQQLKIMIADYRSDSADHQVHIVLNEQQIIELEKERTLLLIEFQNSNIEKEAAL